MKSTCHNKQIKHYQNGYYCPVCFKEHSKPFKGLWLLYFGLTLLFIITINPVKAPSVNRTLETWDFYSYSPEDITPTDNSVLEELVKNKCVLASVAVAQARIETGNYTSDIALNNKNLFGIKVHSCKYVLGERKGHATFASFRDCIACYCKIQTKYLSKIDKAYAEDSLYCQKVKQMK
jgi:hypothetical protein